MLRELLLHGGGSGGEGYFGRRFGHGWRIVRLVFGRELCDIRRNSWVFSFGGENFDLFE